MTCSIFIKFLLSRLAKIRPELLKKLSLDNLRWCKDVVIYQSIAAITGIPMMCNCGSPQQIRNALGKELHGYSTCVILVVMGSQEFNERGSLEILLLLSRNSFLRLIHHSLESKSIGMVRSL